MDHPFPAKAESTRLLQVPPPVKIIDYICGAMKTQAIHACAELGIADFIKEGPRHLADLAQASGTNQTNLYRLLRVLVALEVLVESEPGFFGATPLSRLLQSDGPLYNLALMVGASWQWQVLEGNEGTGYSLRSGQPAFAHIYGKDIWAYLQEHPEESVIFNRAMNATVGVSDEPVAQVLAETYDLAGKTLVDVGGGVGSFLIVLLQQNPELRGVLFDRPEVIAQARERVAQAGVLDRCELVGGNFFEEIPSGGNYYFLRQIIKDWTDEEDIRILHNCQRVMQPGGKILVAETILAPGTADMHAKLNDFVLMMTLVGRERDQVEFEQLFAQAGLTLGQILSTPSPYKILEVF